MKKVLIVEDDHDLVRGLMIRLRNQGYLPVAVQDALSVIPVARKEHPDVILLDLGLPAGDGFVVMERLQAIPALAAIPVVVLTARDPDSARQRSLSAGAAAFLRKPVAPALLLEVLKFATGESDNDLREAAGGDAH